MRLKQPYKVVNGLAVAILLVNAGCAPSSGDSAAAAKVAMAAFDYETARVHLSNALQDKADDPALLLMDGELALALGDPERAKTSLGRLAENPQWSARALPLLAKAYLMGGSPQLAVQTLAKAGKLDALGHAVSVSAALTQGMGDKAQAELDAALLSHPDSLDLGVLDGARALSLGDMAKAQAIASRLLAKHAGNPEALMLAGRVALARQDLPGAETHLKAVLEHIPGHQTALLAMAAIARDKGDAKAAKQYATTALDRSPGNPVARYFAAQMAFDSGDIENAAKLLHETEEAQAQFPSLAMLNGLVAARQGKHEQAIAHLRKFLQSGGEDGRARLALAGSLSAMGDKAGAWAVLKPVADAANANAAVLKLASSLAGSLSLPDAANYAARAARAGTADPIAKDMLAADAAIRAGNWKKADTIYTALLAAGHSDNIVLLNNAANARLELGDAAGAVTIARKAQALAPADPIVMDTLGWALFKSQGDGPEVTRLLGEAARAMPGNLEIRDHVNTVANARSRKTAAAPNVQPGA